MVKSDAFLGGVAFEGLMLIILYIFERLFRLLNQLFDFHHFCQVFKSFSN